MLRPVNVKAAFQGAILVLLACESSSSAACQLPPSMVFSMWMCSSPSEVLHQLHCQLYHHSIMGGCYIVRRMLCMLNSAGVSSMCSSTGQTWRRLRRLGSLSTSSGLSSPTSSSRTSCSSRGERCYGGERLPPSQEEPWLRSGPCQGMPERGH
jgi:hypothetical protein